MEDFNHNVYFVLLEERSDQLLDWLLNVFIMINI